MRMRILWSSADMRGGSSVRIFPDVRFGVLLAALTWSATTFAADPTLQCPPELPAGAVQLTLPQQGWTAYAPARLRLHSVGFMDGPPAEMADLMPTTIDQKKGRSTVTWRFTGGAMVRGRWLSCGYGDGNEITLSKKVPDNTKTCTVYYRNGTFPNFQDIAVECK
jgi:hypothetical protein